MGSRPGTTYKKRQKELARQEKQREKAAKRALRRSQKHGLALESEAARTPDVTTAGGE